MDLLSLLIETAEAPTHVAPLMIFQLPARAPVNTVVAMVAAWRRAQPIPPFNYLPDFPRVGLPRWKVASEIDMHYHVRHFTLPAPGTTEQLRELIEVLHTGRLDRERPLFQVWMIDGLEGGRFAVYPKMHHAIIDGMSAIMRVVGSLAESLSGKLLPPIHALKMGETQALATAPLTDKLAVLGGAVTRRAIASKELSQKPRFPSVRASRDVLRYSGRRVVALELLSVYEEGCSRANIRVRRTRCQLTSIRGAAALFSSRWRKTPCAWSREGNGA